MSRHIDVSNCEYIIVDNTIFKIDFLRKLCELTKVNQTEWRLSEIKEKPDAP